MSSYSYNHKRSDHRAGDDWRLPARLRKSRKRLLLICVIVGLAYWHISHAHSTINVQPLSRQDSATGKHDLEALHKRLYHAHLRDGSAEVRQKGSSSGEKKLDDYRLSEVKPENQDLSRKDWVAVPEPEGSHQEEDPSTQKSTSKMRKFEDEDSEEPEGRETKKVQAQKDNERQLDETRDWKKGPVQVEAELDQNHEKESVLVSPDAAAKQKVIEAEPDEHLTLEETAENLPDIVYVTFEEAVKDHKLEGWEDGWVSQGNFDSKQFKLKEPKVDFVYLWVNGSEEAFQTTKRPYEEKSVLNDPGGVWLSSHGVNRYRDWDELRYAVRSVEGFAKSFRNQIQIIVNSVKGTEAGKQVPSWLNDKPETKDVVRVLAQEEFMDKKASVCLPTFNSLTIENQLFNTPSDTDYMFALSDDMLLGKPHAASDIVSPLFGPVLGFKPNQYNTINPPTDADAHRFGEKPFLIYTSWLLNRRFGNRKRKGQSHFGHALSRSIMREAIGSFPGPELESACKRFRGEPGFQLYSWFVTFHYLIERHREAMLWSFITLRSDHDQDGYMSWDERTILMSALKNGMQNEGRASFRRRNFYHVRQHLEETGLEAPKVNTDFLWTSLDGPSSLISLDCSEFEVNECLAPGFSISERGQRGKNPSFSTAVIFERLTRQKPQCGDCVLKLILNQVERGLEPILPHADSQAAERETVVKALMRYKYTIVEPNALFMMVTDADQIDSALTGKFIRDKRQMPGQMCLNDDVATTDDQELTDIRGAMTEFYQGLFPEKSQFEK